VPLIPSSHRKNTIGPPEEFKLDGVVDMRVAVSADTVPKQPVTLEAAQCRWKVALFRHVTVGAGIDAVVGHRVCHSNRGAA
jgi:hypothetical protein